MRRAGIPKAKRGINEYVRADKSCTESQTKAERNIQPNLRDSFQYLQIDILRKEMPVGRHICPNGPRAQAQEETVHRKTGGSQRLTRMTSDDSCARWKECDEQQEEPDDPNGCAVSRTE